MGMRWILLCVILGFISTVEACHGGGMSGASLFILVPLLIIGTPIVMAGNAIQAVGRGAAGAGRGTSKRTTNIVNSWRKRLRKSVGNDNFNAYYQELYESVVHGENGTLSGYLDLGKATFLHGNDLITADKYVTKAIDIVSNEKYHFAELGNLSEIQVNKDVLGVDLSTIEEHDRAELAEAFFVRGLYHQYLRLFEDSRVYFEISAELLDGLVWSRYLTVEQSIRSQLNQMKLEQLDDYLLQREIEVPENISLVEKRACVYNFRHTKPTQKGAFEFPVEDQVVPGLTRDVALNSAAFAGYLHALYDCNDKEKKKALLERAIRYFSLALEECDAKNKTPEGMYFFNRGKAYYYLSYIESQNYQDLALADFNAAVASDNFGTTAEGHAMLAQSLARQGKFEAAEIELEKAQQLDSRVFTVNLHSADELCDPWPLPFEDFVVHQKAAHQLEEVTLLRPRWCDHCLHSIKTPKAVQCKKCKYLIHKGCQTNILGNSCWLLAGETEANQSKPLNHVHQLKSVWLHGPTWCGVFNKFIKSPKNNYGCIECPFKCHGKCAGGAVAAIVPK